MHRLIGPFSIALIKLSLYDFTDVTVEMQNLVHNKIVFVLTGVTAEMQNLVHRRIYPFLLMVVVLMGILSFQVRQFKRLYEHIKNDK